MDWTFYYYFYEIMFVVG